MSISKQSLQIILPVVEGLNLPEGEYLAFCNFMKKEFEKPEETSFNIVKNTSVIFRGKRDYTIILHSITNYRSSRPNEAVFSINGGQQKTKTMIQFLNSLRKIYIINKTSSIGIVEDEIDETLFLELYELVNEYSLFEANMSGRENGENGDSQDFICVMDWAFCI